jgi:Na+/melibiose symporter-like transporter
MFIVIILLVLGVFVFLQALFFPDQEAEKEAAVPESVELSLNKFTRNGVDYYEATRPVTLREAVALADKHNLKMPNLKEFREILKNRNHGLVVLMSDGYWTLNCKQNIVHCFYNTELGYVGEGFWQEHGAMEGPTHGLLLIAK